MRFFGKKLTDEQRAEELFSPYIDGQVTAGEREFLERYLAAHPDAREKFEILKTAVRMTRRLPAVKAPRSFALPRSMARKPSLTLRLYPAMRLATVAAMALFAFALVGDLATASRLVPAMPAAETVVSARLTEAQVTEVPTPEPFGVAAPAAAPTATGAPTALALESTTAVTATPAPAPAAAAEATTVVTEQALADVGQARNAVEPTPEPGPAVTTTNTVTTAQQIDALRVAVFGLAGITVVLAAATLIVRLRIH